MLEGFQNAATGQLKLTDGTPSTPMECVVDTSGGDFSLSGPLKLVLNETVNVMSRNRLIGTAVGARILPTLSFSALVASLSHATKKTVLDFLLGNESFATRVSTIAGDKFFHCDVTYTNGDDTIVCHDVEIQIDSFTENTETNTLSFTGTVRGEIEINGMTLAEYVAQAA